MNLSPIAVPAPFPWGNGVLDFENPRVMGVVNVTPDSFHSGSRAQHVDQALILAEQMVREGADILDVGGQSTRPGSKQVDCEEEVRRVIPVIEAIRAHFSSTPISVDTHSARVASLALDHGADFINDVGAALLDPAMEDLLVARHAPCILMHMQGTPATMQIQPRYEDVVNEVLDFLLNRLKALKNRGVQHIALDPGFGFGKSLEHNYRLLDRLPLLVDTGAPILVGVSRKSMIQKVLDCESVNALNGTTVLHAWAIDRGAHILRVHDVAEAVECVKLHAEFRAARKGPQHD